MAKYIDADALEAGIAEDCRWELGGGFRRAIGKVIRRMDNMPAADVEPVRHGHWIRETDGGTRCSCCMETVKEDSSGVKIPVDLSDMAYCPKCGAKIDGGSE